MTEEELRNIEEINSHFIKEYYKINNLQNWEIIIKELICEFIDKHHYYPEFIVLNSKQFSSIQNQIIINKTEVLKYSIEEDMYDIVKISQGDCVSNLFFDGEIIAFYGAPDIEKDNILLMVDSGPGESIPIFNDGTLYINLGEY